jgi:site-specific DNA-cytosine methylase
MLGDAENADDIAEENDGYSKANTFMASKTRLDDHPRMSKVRKAGERYFRSTYSAQEREWMMGYPAGYVVNHAAEQSAKHLIGNAYSVPVVSFLLKPLTQVFKRRAYYGYNFHRANGKDMQGVYSYKWQV